MHKIILHPVLIKSGSAVTLDIGRMIIPEFVPVNSKKASSDTVCNFSVYRFCSNNTYS